MGWLIAWWVGTMVIGLWVDWRVGVRTEEEVYLAAVVGMAWPLYLLFVMWILWRDRWE